VFGGLPVERTYFPLKYLGFPLPVWHLRRSDFEHLEDKVIGKISTRNEKFVTKAGHTSLVKPILASQSVYHPTTLIVPPGTLHNIRRLSKLSCGRPPTKFSEASVRSTGTQLVGPKILVGWLSSTLSFFSRALRLRWPWVEWKSPIRRRFGLVWEIHATRQT
jgi:hypothetical protein